MVQGQAENERQLIKRVNGSPSGVRFPTYPIGQSEAVLIIISK